MAVIVTPHKPNVQLFRDDEFSKAMMAVSSYMWSVQQLNTWRLQDEFNFSEYFGLFLWDSNLFDLARYFPRDYWGKNYRSILYAMEIAGTHESYLTVIRSALGNVAVTFENPNPAHLIIRMNPGFGLLPWEALYEGQREVIQTPTEANGMQDIEFADSVSNLGINETLKLLEHLIPNGIFVEVVIE